MMGPTEEGKKYCGETMKNYYPNCFNEEMVLCDQPWKHSLDTADARLIKTHGQPHTPTEHVLVKQFIEDSLKHGIIETLFSPWSTTLIMIRKPDRSTQVCVDYCGLNTFTQKNAYLFPLIDDISQFVSE